MKYSQTNGLKNRQWRMLLIYNIYRLLCIVVLAATYWFVPLLKLNQYLFFGSLSVYFVFAILLFFLWYYRKPPFKQQVLFTGIADIIIVVLLVNQIGFIDSGLGVLLYVYIVMLSILVPGRLAIFFAAVASCALLSINTFNYLSAQHKDVAVFFSSGVFGAGFFATALTAWYLANWVRANEQIAASRAMELENLHKLNEYIVERLQYGVIYIDSKQRVKVINAAACKFLNIDAFNPNLSLKQISPELYEKYIKFINHKGNKTEEKTAQTTINNLQVYFYSSTATAEKASVLVFINDLAEVAQKAQQMKMASLGFFSASIAHELRNPLGAISHACQLLGEDEELDQEEARLKELILNNCERMNKIIKNVLQISRSEKSEPESIELGELLKKFREDFCGVNQCKISLSLPREKYCIQFDRSQLEQVLVILCDNAMEHGKDPELGYANITIRIDFVAGNPVLEVWDTGPGIQEKNRKNIFDPFFTTQISGNGMGLFIARDLCEINHARLELKDTDTGCCFVIVFNQQQEVTL